MESPLRLLLNDLIVRVKYSNGRCITEFKQRQRVSKKQLQSLAGKLNWASAVVHGGRVFLRRIINSFTCLRQDWHKIRVQGELLADITWWQDFIASFNGKSLILDKIPVTSVITDACRSGGGGFHDLDWFYVNWEQDFPGCSSFHINELEAFSVILAAKRWSSSWENKRVIVLCDNMATVACINKCIQGTRDLKELDDLVLHFRGINSSQYSGHSFRRGGASFALECGLPGEVIQAHGDWRSDAYKAYLDPSLSYRHQVMHAFATAFTSSSLK
ncbi:unnamed protein product [Mytilus coruscus]|uniref:Tyr recombinase domain-containing protein n=1 Tax=Mytilus coruscus TaxID=42192 RepID=A0A6J8CFF2_MYTCO|nr:unnamed protein product [Mytilus coruscus]